MRKTLLPAACLCVLVVSGSRLDAGITSIGNEGEVIVAPGSSADVAAQEQEKRKQASPWLFIPLVSTDPKLGSTFGALGAWLHYFDPQSQVSMFGAIAEYSTTDSMVGALFARTSFGADRHRLEGLGGFGYIRNEYKDYLGSGETLETTDDIRMIAARYLYRAKGSWFIGTQGAFANYTVSGASAMDDKVLNILGITGFNSGGVGAVVMLDSRDNQDMPVKGWYANLNNLANREWLGAEADYDTYRLDVRWFREHGKGHVFTVRQNNQFTADAPPSAEATIQLRGYKLEQYLGTYMSSIEGEERIRFSKRWGATIFGGIGWLYGTGDRPINSDGSYPSYGAGVHFILKPEDHMLMNLEYADGNHDNHGIYLRFGYGW